VEIDHPFPLLCFQKFPVSPPQGGVGGNSGRLGETVSFWKLYKYYKIIRKFEIWFPKVSMFVSRKLAPKKFPDFSIKVSMETGRN
jgi:hypothetical protein